MNPAHPVVSDLGSWLKPVFAPITAGRPVVVHASFRGLGRMGWSPQDFCQGLIDEQVTARQGLLAMPAMSWRLCTSDYRFFHELTTPSITGQLSEVFRRDFASHRSLHPTHSLACLGAGAEGLVNQHHLDATPCSPRSPWGQLIAQDGYVVLFDVDYSVITLIHCAEEQVAPEFYFRPNGEIYYLQDRHRQIHPLYLRRHLPLPRDFNQFAAPLQAQGRAWTGEQNGVRWHVVKAADLHQLVLWKLRQRPDGTLAETPLPAGRDLADAFQHPLHF